MWSYPKYTVYLEIPTSFQKIIQKIRKLHQTHLSCEEPFETDLKNFTDVGDNHLEYDRFVGK